MNKLTKTALVITLIGIITILVGYYKPGLIFFAIAAFLVCIEIGDK